MHHTAMKFLTGPMILLLVIFGSQSVSGQTINVTMELNTATNPDTVMEHHTVQIRGASTGDVVPVTWDAGTGLSMESAGGDYWTITFEMSAGDTLTYKFWTGFNDTTGTMFWDGWEGPINAGFSTDNNRGFIAGSQDTTLPLQFYHGNESTRDQYWRPYEAHPDSFAVYFRVNMAALMETGDFDPETDGPVAVRGGPPIDPTPSEWDTEVVLSREEGSALDGSFYSGAVQISNDSVSAGDVQEYKFVYTQDGTVIWESISNRTFPYSGTNDTTIHWSFFDNASPAGGDLVEASLIWRIKTDGMEALGLFDRGLGEEIVIDGAKGWDIDNAIQMNYQPLLQLWLGQESFLKAPGASMEYKAVILWDSSRVDSTSDNYIPGLELETPLQYWEEAGVTGTGNRTYEYGSATEQSIPGDYGFEYQYFNGIPEEGVINSPMTLNFSIDMNPAADAESNPSNPLFRPGVDSCWIFMYGSLVGLTQGYGIYENVKTIQLEDPDGDLVYTGSWDLEPPFPYGVAYRVGYSAEGGAEVTNGGGFQRGRSYYQYVRPNAVTEEGTIAWPDAYDFPTLDWMDGDLTVEDPPNLWEPTAVEEEPGGVAGKFALAQNYPNPFNPETMVSYQVAKSSQVRITVYDLTGRKVISLVNTEQAPGSYSVVWNGRDLHGNAVSSGIYLLRMEAGVFSRVRKMTLLR